MAASLDIQALINSLGDYREKAREAARRAVYKFAAKVLQDAIALAPIKTGFLKGPESATQLEAIDVDGLISCEIGFNAKYAAAVHEVLTAVHPQGQAKYLETAMRANAPDLLNYVKDEMRKEGIPV
jgi:hypothetical protein